MDVALRTIKAIKFLNLLKFTNGGCVNERAPNLIRRSMIVTSSQVQPIDGEVCL